MKFLNTKIVATVGPACNSYRKLLALAEEGVNVFRLNFSHGTHEEHLQVMSHINYINNKYNMHVGILADLQGPKLRVGKIKDNGILLKEGQHITFSNEPCLGTKEKVYMSYPQFAQDVTPGEKVLIDDGKLELRVFSTNEVDSVVLEVMHGGILSSNKGVNLPDTKISLPSMTKKDFRDLEFILKQEPVNWVALSFVRSAKDITELKALIKKGKRKIKIIAKIEKPEAIKDIDEIILESHAVMVARGDLGVEVPMERLPLIQKMIVEKCIHYARPVIVATQMMDSMITNPSPTRAEITDVANAVLDGADAVMLSGETSVGKHPRKVVAAMRKIINEVEQHGGIYFKGLTPDIESPTFLSDAICYNSCKIAREVNARAIVGMTKSGYTAFLVSSCRPSCRIYIFSDNNAMLKTLNLVWGIQGFYYDKFTSTDETINDVQEILKREGHADVGDIIINTGTMPLHQRGRTNMLRISKIK